MPETPEPPANLDTIPLPIVTNAMRRWYRICQRGRNPLFWNRSGDCRFDSPDARYGVCYMAVSVTAAFRENWCDKVRDEVVIPFEKFDSREVWEITLPEGTGLLPLKQGNIMNLRATLNCFSGDDYRLSQRWAARFMEHPGPPDGLIYIGRRCADDCLALFGNEDDLEPKSPVQSRVSMRKLGDLVEWAGFYPLLVDSRIRTTEITRKLSIVFHAP